MGLTNSVAHDVIPTDPVTPKDDATPQDDASPKVDTPKVGENIPQDFFLFRAIDNYKVFRYCQVCGKERFSESEAKILSDKALTFADYRESQCGRYVTNVVCADDKCERALFLLVGGFNSYDVWNTFDHKEIEEYDSSHRTSKDGTSKDGTIILTCEEGTIIVPKKCEKCGFERQTVHRRTCGRCGTLYPDPTIQKTPATSSGSD